MCGIVGSLGFALSEEVAKPLMRQRGPDEFTSFQSDGVTFFHSRLKIIGKDSADARQPMTVNQKTLVCNGFISNFLEIEGHATSDCAAVLSVYEKYGCQGFGKLRGQFAVAILDALRGRLILARDHTGICPLYYHRPSVQSLVFASQAHWFSELLNGRKFPLDPEAVEQWRSFGYVISPKTLYRDVFAVRPGTALELSLADGEIVDRHVFASFQSADASASKLRDKIDQAVGRNLQSDFPPWLLLSGGVDSLILLHCAVDRGIRPQTLTLAYPDNQNASEVARARELADYYGCPWHVVPYQIGEPRPRLFSHRVDWPMDFGSLLPKLAMANYIRELDGKVVLGGSGADEIFGGYGRHRKRLELLHDKKELSHDEERAYFRDAIGKLGGCDEEAFRVFREEKASPRFNDPAFVYDWLEISEHHVLRLDSCFSNIGIEYRPPYHDFDLVSLASRFPLAEKTSMQNPKKILKEAFSGEVAERFLQAPKQHLRFGGMGPNPEWQSKVWDTWILSQRKERNRCPL